MQLGNDEFESCTARLVNEDEVDEDAEDESILDLCHCSSFSFGCVSTCIFQTFVGRLILTIAMMILVFLIYITRPWDSESLQMTASTRTGFNPARANNILNSLCDDYENGEASGNLCETFCGQQNWTIVDFQQGASKRVIRLSVNGSEYLIKSTRDYIREFEHIDANVDENELTEKILYIVNDRANLGWPMHYKNHLLKALWPSYDLRRTDPQLTAADKRSLWALLQQDEFITFTMFPLSRATTKVYGSCGHFYAVDLLLPFHMKGYYMGLKAKILVHLMGTLKLFYEFLNDPIQWCDVKFENLGLAAQYPKRFMIMDADMLYTESKLNQILTTRSCSTDDDCKYFDCISKCDNSTNFCTKRINDNIDVFCQKLVGRLFGTYWSKSNRYLAACHDTSGNSSKRLADLRLVWSWSLTDV